MNQVIIDINKFYKLLHLFYAKELDEGLFKHERAFYRGGRTALTQVLIDNNLTGEIDEKFPKTGE